MNNREHKEAGVAVQKLAADLKAKKWYTRDWKEDDICVVIKEDGKPGIVELERESS